MFSTLLLVALAADAPKPVSLFVRGVGGGDAQQGIVWSEVIAAEFRRYGIRVTTEGDLSALLAGKSQQQKLGCADADCGLDPEIIKNADAIVATNIGMGDDALINMRLDKNVAKLDARIAAEFATVSRNDIPGGLKELVPKMVEKLRVAFPDRIAAGPASSGKSGTEDPPKTKRCSATGGEALLVLAALWLTRRRRQSFSFSTVV